MHSSSILIVVISIVVQKNSTVVDGAGYTLQGLGRGRGFNLTIVSNITITNTEINRSGEGRK